MSNGAGENRAFTAEMAAEASYRRPSMIERLRADKAQYERKLEACNAALAALEASPTSQSIIDMIEKVRTV